MGGDGKTWHLTARQTGKFAERQIEKVGEINFRVSSE
jgi:hypothetical protein